MATTLARMSQLIGSTSDWAANDIVLNSGELGLEVLDSGLVSGKVGDGVNTYANLPYTFGVSAAVSLSGDQDIDGIKTFTSDIRIQNQSTTAKYGRLWSDDFPTVHSVALDSNEISSNLYLQARDAAGAAQTLACGADGSLYWKSTKIADETGLAGVTWGGFDDLGVVTRGTGFSVSHPATGQYDLVFDEASFDNVSQAVVACSNAQVQSSLSCTVQMAGATTCTIWVATDGDVPADSSVSFTRNYIPA